jgi:hypothetical protein
MAAKTVECSVLMMRERIPVVPVIGVQIGIPGAVGDPSRDEVQDADGKDDGGQGGWSVALCHQPKASIVSVRAGSTTGSRGPRVAASVPSSSAVRSRSAATSARWKGSPKLDQPVTRPSVAWM